MSLSSLRQRSNLDGKATMETTTMEIDKSRTMTTKRRKAANTHSTSSTLPQRITESVQLKRRMKWKHIISMAIALVLFSRIVPRIHSIIAILSTMIESDKFLLHQYRLQAEETRLKALREMGIELPMLDIRNVPTKAFSSPFGLLAETLIRTVRRKRQIQHATAWVNATGNDTCRRHRMTRSHSVTTINAMPTADWPCSGSGSIPPWILQPNHDSSYRPLYGLPPTWQMIPFDEASMRMFLQENYPKHILKQYDSATHPAMKIHIWTWCALYHFGGVVLDKRVRHSAPLLEPQLSIKGACDDDAIALFQPNTLNPSNLDLALFAASPRHPLARCVIEQQGWHMLTSLQDLFSYDWKLHKALPDSQRRHSIWKKIMRACGTAASEVDCCISLIENMTAKVAPLVKVQERNKSSQAQDHQSHAVVRVTRKTHFQERVHPGFFCNRCLRNPRYGSFDTCSRSCGSLQCRKTLSDEDDTINVRVAALQHHGNFSIPKIVHQAWLEPPESHRFPELARLQNTWKHSGYDYRFYTLKDAHNYVATHFHKVILEAYDALGVQFKLDLFRLLLLLREGGVYADMDVMLETNLDYFLTPTMSFFAPRDMIESLAGEDFCLWNGFLGASPGHPFIIRAVERMTNIILKRVIPSDIEQDACRAVGKTLKVWKMKAVPSASILSGSCLLGMAVNDVTKKSDLLAKFEPGWTIHNDRSFSEYDDILVLMGDRGDMGTFRFSDIERNLVVASTNIVGLSKGDINKRIPSKTSNVRISDLSSLNEAPLHDFYNNKHVFSNSVNLNVVFTEERD